MESLKKYRRGIWISVTCRVQRHGTENSSGLYKMNADCSCSGLEAGGRGWAWADCMAPADQGSRIPPPFSFTIFNLRIPDSAWWLLELNNHTVTRQEEKRGWEGQRTHLPDELVPLKDLSWKLPLRLMTFCYASSATTTREAGKWVLDLGTLLPQIKLRFCWWGRKGDWTLGRGLAVSALVWKGCTSVHMGEGQCLHPLTLCPWRHLLSQTPNYHSHSASAGFSASSHVGWHSFYNNPFWFSELFWRL